MRNWLRTSVLSALPVLSVATLGFVQMNESLAQQPPAWSPQPYAKPSAATNALPVNSLRELPQSEDATQANAQASTRDISNSSTTAVARWRKIEQAAEPRARSYNSAFVADNSQSAPTGSVEQIDAPKEAAPALKRNAVTPARRMAESRPAESQPAVSEENTNEIRLVSAVSTRDNTESFRRGASQSANQSTRRGSAVSVASYQDLSEPPSLSLPPVLPAAPTETLPQQSQPRAAGEPQLLPRGQELNLGNESPSDRLQPGNRRPPTSQSESTYRRPESRSTSDCDALRESIQNADITKIRVDTSPAFVEGYRSNQEKSSKDAFIREATNRAWYNMEGVEIARGRLVDMGYGAVVIQSADGSKVNYLLNRLSEADHVYVAEAWGIPVTCALNDGSFDSRDFIASTMTWKASGACHKPLYFEEVQLERYGHEWGPVVQPALSSLNFVKNVAFLPYKMGIHPMNECQYSLGYYRPGSCAPWTVGPVPISLRGAAAQAAVVGGAAWALP